MPSYAVLGATGNCGTALIDNLLRIEDAEINAYCRNRDKLLKSVPQIENNKRVKIFAGSIQDRELLAKCIRGTSAIFHVVTTNTNVPGCNVGFETASNIVAALQMIKSESPSMRMPKVVLLSSATIDDYLARKMPWPFRPIMLTAASYMYDDLRRTEALLREQENWISSIFVKPGGLSADKQRGHKLDFDNEESFISFLDLAAAMIEAADDPSGQYDMKNVSVVNTGGSARIPPGTPLCIVVGLMRHYMPFLHPYLPTPGPS